MIHVLAQPILTRDDAAARLRLDLPRGALRRRRGIEGDLFFLPYRRVRAMGPVGETKLDVLAANIGDPRLNGVRLPAVDLAPFDQAAVPGGARLVAATSSDALIERRAKTLKCDPLKLESLVHYPFWHLRVDDGGRPEAAWVDAVEGTILVHNLKGRPLAPSFEMAAVTLALPAAALALVDLLGWREPVVIAAAVGIAAATTAGLQIWLIGRTRRGEQGET